MVLSIKKTETDVSLCKGTWVEKILEKLEDPEFDMENISNGIATALNTTVLALQAPSELLSSSCQEANNDDRPDITNIEHLFQRLNQQGTRLDGEELIYSLIKAYWPEICGSIDEISKIECHVLNWQLALVSFYRSEKQIGT